MDISYFFETIDKAKAEARELRARVDRLQASANRRQEYEAIHKAEAEARELKARVDRLQASITRLQEYNNTLLASTVKLQGEVTTLRGDKARLEAENTCYAAVMARVCGYLGMPRWGISRDSSSVPPNATGA